MQKFRQYIYQNLWEILYILSLILIFSIFMHFFGNNVAGVIIDLGREAYFPEEVLKGKILYKDIFNIFGPLSYQINAFLYSIFGASFKTLRLIGCINSFITLALVFFISRIFTSKNIAWINTVFIMVSCVFNPWALNYVFSYSYATIYSLNSFLCSTAFLILYFKTNKNLFLTLSWFLAGISMAFKYDYFSYIIFLFLLTIYLINTKKIELKCLFYNISSFLSVPIISFTVLFLQGLTINDLLNQLIIVKKYAESASLNYFYLHSAGLYPSKQSFMIVFDKFIRAGLYFILLLSLIYNALNFYTLKQFKEFFLRVVYTIIIFLILSLTVNTQKDSFWNLSWLPIFTTFIFCFVLISKIIKKRIHSDSNIYLILIFIALLASQKTFFLMGGFIYGIFALPLLFIVNSVFIVEFLPEQFKFINKKIIEKAFVIFLLSYIIIIIQGLTFFIKDSFLVKSKKGDIYNNGTAKINAIITQKTINYIEENINPEKSIWVIPEGNIINFLTNNPTSSIYYNVTPPYIDAFGENNIVNWLKKSPPDYVLINDRNTEEYSKKYLCKDYGFKICNYVKNNYSPVKQFYVEEDTKNSHDVYAIVIYKKIKKL